MVLAYSYTLTAGSELVSREFERPRVEKLEQEDISQIQGHHINYLGTFGSRFNNKCDPTVII